MVTSDMPGQPTGVTARGRAVSALLGLIILGFVVFWIWALFFASKEAVNKIEDRAWAERAERICAETKPLIRALDLEASSDLVVRADLVDRSTGLLRDMLDQVVAVEPADAKGRAIVPQWEADYRTLLGNRDRYADQLRAGVDGPFREAEVDGIPISEKIETFAGDNEMPSCAPPRASIL